MKSWLLCITTLDVWGVKYPRWHGDFPGICSSSLSVSHEHSFAKVFNSFHLPGFGPENSKHQSLSKAHPHGLGHAHSGMPQWQMELAQRDALIRCSTYRPATSHSTKYSLCATVPWCKWKQQCVLLVVFVAYKRWFRGYRWKWDQSLWLTSTLNPWGKWYWLGLHGISIQHWHCDVHMHYSHITGCAMLIMQMNSNTTCYNLFTKGKLYSL